MSIRNRTLIIALLLSGMFMGCAKDVKSLQIVFTDIYMTTICSITPSYFDKNLPHTKQFLTHEEKSSSCMMTTKPRICTLVPSSLYTEGNYMSCPINSSV